MTGDLMLTVLHQGGRELGHLAGFAVTDRLIVAAGGVSNRHPTVVASSNARRFESRATPRGLGLRGVAAAGDALWLCGEYGQLAVSHDRGASWRLLDTGTDACLYSVAVARDGAVWVVGDGGFAARVGGGGGGSGERIERIERIELATTARLSRVYAIGDEMVALGCDGNLRRWRAGQVTTIATGSQRALTGLAIGRGRTWIVAGEGGFVARSPDGTWFSRVHSGLEVDLEAIAAIADGRLIAVGDRGQIVVSNDDGRTWAPVGSELVAHLWSVERFGGGVLIGGDDGLIVKLAPRDDATWVDRTDVFAEAQALDVAFAGGPVGFVDGGLRTYLAAVASVEHAAPVAVAVKVDDDDDDDDHDNDDDGDGDDHEASAILSLAGDATSFAAIYGVPLPAEVAHFRDATHGLDRARSFDELRLDRPLLPDVGDRNLFELLVRRNQHAYLGTELVEAFCGVFALGSQHDGDTYHLELYEWDRRRQVLHFDHATAAFTGVFADSLDSLVYLAALGRAGRARLISPDAYAVGVRQLRGKIAPTRHFAIADDDPAFVRFEPKRRDTEFFCFRARWIVALLKHDGVTGVEDLPELFAPDFNQVIPAEQLPARFEACEKFIPTALYAMWRGYLFDEPELERYLELGRRHRARLVRDAARLIDELRAGRTELGTITDVPAWLAAFRALDLDPRRARARDAEAIVRESAGAARRDEIPAELLRTPTAEWGALAWRWLDDGVAHRALLEQLDRTPDGAAQIAALDELRQLGDDERAIALPRVAAALSPALEAILVGSLVRGDALAGVLAAPTPAAPAIGRATTDEGATTEPAVDDASAPGWDAIDAALAPIYRGVKPKHYGTVVPAALGGNDPIHGISVYVRSEPVPHFHFVTYGFTDLFVKETDDPDDSGFGFELSMRVGRAPDDDDPPMWVLHFLQNLGRYVFSTGNAFAAGHKMGLNGPIALAHETLLTAICFADDPELGAIDSPFGAARFVQVVGVTDDEYRVVQEWSTPGLIEILRRELPLLITDLARASVLANPVVRAEVEARVEREGSSEELTFAGELRIAIDDDRARIELGALYAPTLPRAMRGRIRHGRAYELRGRAASIQLTPSSAVGFSVDDRGLALDVTIALAAEIEAKLGAAQAGVYRFAEAPLIEIVVTPSFIRAQDGTAIEVRGIADVVEAARMIAEENARLADDDHIEDNVDTDADDDDDVDVDDTVDADGDVDGDGDDTDDADDDVADPLRVRAALAMTARALLLAPADTDVQYTHMMLLLDADRTALPGALAQLLSSLPGFSHQVRLHAAVALGKLSHPRFSDVLDVALFEPRTGAPETIAPFDDVATEVLGELGELILAVAPARMTRLISLLPDDVALLADLGWKAIEANHREHAIALYDRLLALPIPDDGDERTTYLRALNNACVQAHAARAFDTAARIADRAQPVAHENPYIFHSAACAYAAIGDLPRAFEQVKHAVAHDYAHLDKLEVDADLGGLLEWPELKSLFADWHARQEGN